VAVATPAKRFFGDATRILLIASGSAMITYGGQHQAAAGLVIGGLMLLVGVAAVIIARIDCETMIHLALQQPATTTREQLAQLMQLPYWD
jgi:hypothetical protein